MLTSILVPHPEANLFHRAKGIFTAKAGVVALLAVSSVALAHTYERCDADGDHCVRISCDNDGDRCWREGRERNHARVAFRCVRLSGTACCAAGHNLAVLP
jgi:hypothetical protein